MKNFGLFAAVAAAGMVPAASADAATLLFTITGDYDASFTLDSDPVPDVVNSGTYFTVWDIPGFADALLGVADVTFYNAGIGGGFAIEDYYGGTTLLVTDAAQLYSGTEEDPTLLTGTFAMTAYMGTGNYTLTVTDISVVAPVPEPGTWAMMIGGFGLMGGLMRRRQRANVTVSYA